MIEVRRVRPDELEAAVEFVVERNAHPETHVAYYGSDPGEIRGYVRGLRPDPLEGMFVALEEGRLAGVLTLEYERDLARAWIHGPQVDPPDRADLAARLYETAVAALPGEITMHELYFDARNAGGEAFARAHGFTVYKDVGILVFPRRALGNLPEGSTLDSLEPADHDAVIALHDRLFPNTYCPGRELVTKPSEGEQVFTVREGPRFAGYIHVRRDPEGRLAHIEFLGVEAAARGRGLGRALLVGAIRWGLEAPEIEQVSLVVEDANERAYGLYLRTGFELERQTRAFRRTLSST